MTPRDTLAADLATLLPGCAVTAEYRRIPRAHTQRANP